MRLQMHWLFESSESAEQMLPEIREGLAGLKRQGKPDVQVNRDGAHVTVDMMSVVFRHW